MQKQDDLANNTHWWERQLIPKLSDLTVRLYLNLLAVIDVGGKHSLRKYFLSVSIGAPDYCELLLKCPQMVRGVLKWLVTSVARPLFTDTPHSVKKQSCMALFLASQPGCPSGFVLTWTWETLEWLDPCFHHPCLCVGGSMRPDKRRFAGEIAGNVFCRHFFLYIYVCCLYISREDWGQGVI